MGSAWDEVAFMPWGDDPDGVGLHPGDEDDLAYGPHGIAVGTDASIVIIDRIHGRALVFAPDGALTHTLRLGGRPGPAALLPDGTVAVLDEAEPRTVRRSDGEQSWSPRWALPPSRLVVSEVDGEVVLAALDAFQHRLPLSSLPGLTQPHEPPRGVPATDGETAVVAVRSEATVEVRFLGEHGDDVVRWEIEVPAGHRPGSVEVLAAAPDSAVLAVETLTTAPGPLQVSRAVTIVDRTGGAGETLAVPGTGPVAIPHDLAASADGTVYLLLSEAAGCRLWRARVEGGAR